MDPNTETGWLFKDLFREIRERDEAYAGSNWKKHGIMMR